VLQIAQGKENHRRDGVGSKQKGEKLVGSGGILLTWEYVCFFFSLEILSTEIFLMKIKKGIFMKCSLN
jgi:hypothetical protein